MKAPERILVWLLRVSGAMTLTALGAVFMPYDWMNGIHQQRFSGLLARLVIQPTAPAGVPVGTSSVREYRA